MCQRCIKEYKAKMAKPKSVCKHCGALKADHIDYGRGYLQCPRAEGGKYED